MIQAALLVSLMFSYFRSQCLYYRLEASVVQLYVENYEYENGMRLNCNGISGTSFNL